MTQLIFLFMAIALIPAPALAWNPFKKKTFEDCVLEKINDVKGEDAVRALRQACAAKYPMENDYQGPSKGEKDTAAEKKACGLPDDHWKNHQIFTLASGRGDISGYTSKIKNVNYNGAAQTVTFVNGNDFSVSAIAIGLTASKTCPTRLEDYSVVVYCGNGTEAGVTFYGSGTLYCTPAPENLRRQGFCVVGFSPIYNKFDDSLFEFMKGHSLCKK